MRCRLLSLPCWFLSLQFWGAASLSASTYVMMTDSALLSQSEVVVAGRVEATMDSGRRVETCYGIAPHRILKGGPAGKAIRVCVPGGRTSGGVELRLRGVPVFRAGEEVLLFLVGRADGSFGIVQMALGAFRQVRSGNRLLAVRDMGGASVLAVGDQEASDRLAGPRDFGAFARWLQEEAEGLQTPPDYFLMPDDRRGLGSGTPPGPLGSRYDLIRFPTFIRWPNFDRGQPVFWRIHRDGQPGLPAEGSDPAGSRAFRKAIQAWNDDPGSLIDYRFGGVTDNFNSLGIFDEENTLVFDDPHNTLPGPFVCGIGGALAVAGPWVRPNQAALHKGINFGIPAGADIVVNDGAECLLEDQPLAELFMEEIYGHELGHTLGLGHSCPSLTDPLCSFPKSLEALMYAFARLDGRGAALGSDDRDGAAFLYGESQVGPGQRLLLFPQVGVGGGEVAGARVELSTTLFLSNAGAATFAQLDFFQSPDGAPLSVDLGGLGSGSSFEIVMQLGESVALDLASEGELRVGYLQVRTGLAVQGTAVFTRRDDGLVVSEAGVPPAEFLSDFSFFYDFLGNRSTGLSLVSPTPAAGVAGDASSTVRLRLYDQGFGLLDESDLVLAPGEHRAFFIQEIFDEVDLAGRRGIVTVASSRPLAALTLRQSDDPEVGFPQEIPILTAFPVLAGRADP